MNKWFKNLEKVLKEVPSKPTKLIHNNSDTFEGFEGNENEQISQIPEKVNTNIKKEEKTFEGFEGNENKQISQILEKANTNIEKEEKTFEGFEGNENSHFSENNEIIAIAEEIFDGVIIDENQDPELSQNEKAVVEYLSNKGFVYEGQISNGIKLSMIELKKTIKKLLSRRYVLAERGKVSLNSYAREKIKGNKTNKNIQNFEKDPQNTTLKTYEINTCLKVDSKKTTKKRTNKTPKINTYSEQLDIFSTHSPSPKLKSVVQK